ncbi:hypothetical protein SAMN04487898_101153 [Pedobacter sp. ok626]|nr:hypothetical protein SAMN04487898_101153 [Pedobacter sp. ok626]
MKVCIIFFLAVFMWIQDSIAQMPIDARIILVDTLLKNLNSHELNLQLYIIKTPAARIILFQTC